MARLYNTMCSHCGGLIMEPYKPYGWAGKVCHCVSPCSSPKSSWEELLKLKEWHTRLDEKDKASGSL